MYQAEQALKDLYQSDSIEKHFIADFYRSGADTPFLSIYDGRRFSSMTLEESLCSSENLDFGSCEASQIKMTLIDVDNSIKGAEMVVYQVMDGLYPAEDLYPGDDVHPSGYTMPFGRYVIQSAERQANQTYRDIVALDYMYKFDVNVIDWYNALSFPLTLKEFRASLCQYIGVTEHVPDYLPHEAVLIEKTIDTATLMGRDVLIACEQLNGVFGHFDRNGVLQHITLQPNYTLMPATDLYPAEDLYPALPGALNDQVYDERIHRKLYIGCEFEEYTVQSVDKVQIRQEEGDIGAIYGDGENCLTVEGNFLVFGKSADELNTIATGIYGMVSSRQYIPYSCELKGLPYIEVGDTELIEAEQGDIVTYVIQRTLKGIYGLRDSHSATGEEIRSTESNINTEIIQLKGKAAILKKNVEEVSAHLIDFEAETEAKFTITAEQIAAEVSRAQEAEASLRITADQISLSVTNLKNYTESQFIQTADQISMKVSKGDVSSQLSIEPDQITLTSNRLSWNSTYSSMTSTGVLTCVGIRAVNGYFSGSLETEIFSASDDEVWIGDYYISADGTNEFRASDSSVIIQTAKGGPGGAYASLHLGGGAWHGVEITGRGLVDCSEVKCLDVYASNCDYAQGRNRLWGLGESLDYLIYDDAPWESYDSDISIKENIKNIETDKALQFIMKLNPISFDYIPERQRKKSDNSRHIGLIAQEVKEVAELVGIDGELVCQKKDGILSIRDRQFYAVIIAAIQELSKKII